MAPLNEPDSTQRSDRALVSLALLFFGAGLLVYGVGSLAYGGREFTISFLASVVTLLLGLAIATLVMVYDRQRKK